MITLINENDFNVTENGEYATAKAHSRGRPIMIEVNGAFDGSTVTIGYVNEADEFVADEEFDHGDADVGRIDVTLTKAGRRQSVRPWSGRPAVKVSGGSTDIDLKFKFMDLLPR
jgi:hypothetical protein